MLARAAVDLQGETRHPSKDYLAVNLNRKGETVIEAKGIHHVALRVTDLGRARAFYVEKLRLPVLLENEARVIVNAFGNPVGLVPAREETPPGDAFNPFRVGLDHVAIGVDGRAALDGILAALEAAGVANNGIEDDRVLGGHYISFHDPDGIAWEFYAPPGA
jgi:catechol 2,3-dioxygenase-like lactoylglutathione lyase family enzyme